MDMAQVGMPMMMDATGHMTRSGRKHARMSTSITMSGTQEQSQGTVEIGMLMVADGSVMWTEMDNPIMGGKQVMKIGIDRMEEMASASPGMGIGGGWTGMDPVSQIRQLSELFDFDVSETTGGRVVLSAAMTEEALSRLGVPAAAAATLTSFTLVVDEATGFPTELRLGGEAPLMVMGFTNFRKLDDSAIDPELFTYTPPEGAQVMDLGAMADGVKSLSESE
jgi:hypothetical protein